MRQEKAFHFDDLHYAIMERAVQDWYCLINAKAYLPWFNPVTCTNNLAGVNFKELREYFSSLKYGEAILEKLEADLEEQKKMDYLL